MTVIVQLTWCLISSKSTEVSGDRIRSSQRDFILAPSTEFEDTCAQSLVWPLGTSTAKLLYFSESLPWVCTPWQLADDRYLHFGKAILEGGKIDRALSQIRWQGWNDRDVRVYVGGWDSLEDFRFRTASLLALVILMHPGLCASLTYWVLFIWAGKNITTS